MFLVRSTQLEAQVQLLLVIFLSRQMVGAQSTRSVDSGARRPHVAGAKDRQRSFIVHYNNVEKPQ